jgi:hypothetical protein
MSEQYTNRGDYFAAIAAKQAAKPVVKYRPAYSEQPIIGRRFDVIPTNHPAAYLNGELVSTSMVVASDGQGNFETLNTRYVLEAA